MGTLLTCEDDHSDYKNQPVVLCHSNGEKYIGSFNSPLDLLKNLPGFRGTQSRHEERQRNLVLYQWRPL